VKLAYVEDDADARTIFSRKFRADGIACDPYPSAEAALEKINVGSYDALVVDIRLPGMSGVEFLAKLREKGVHTPCLLITAFSSAGLTKQAVNSGANYLLEKPFAYGALKGTVLKMLETPAPLQHCVDRGLGRLGLTPREEEVARLLLKGLSNAEIARAAALSEKTVKQYVTQVFAKADVSSRSAFFSYIFPV
jgi:DNA-binding NarL/FixJ family response regulator